MGEYNITKIIDGLFISDSLVPEDSTFMVGNKIIRVLGWTSEPEYHQLEDEGILEFSLPKSLAEVKFPTYEQLVQGFTFLEAIHDEMLCGLIYSESELEAALICIMYLMHRYHWDCNTSYAFLKNKMEIFQFSDQAIDELERYQRQLSKSLNLQLSHILWDYDFLINYKATTDQQILIVNTIKNKLRKDYSQKMTNKAKKQKRIKWQDQIRPSSAFSINSAKPMSRSSLVKNRLNSPAQCLIAQQEPSNKDLQLFQNSLGLKSMLGGKIMKEKRDQNIWEQDQDYLQLKELSRTNFNDKRYMSSKLKRRSSLKPNKKQQNQQKHQSSINLQNINTIVGIYSSTINLRSPSDKPSGLSKFGGGHTFLSSLRSFNKLSMGNA